MEKVKFNFTESFVCVHCESRWMFRADSLTSLVAKVKASCNDEIQSHYVLCCADKAINQAKSFDERFCKFLKSIGINASVMGDV